MSYLLPTMKRRRFMRIWKFMLSFVVFVVELACSFYWRISRLLLGWTEPKKNKQNPAESKLCWHLISAKTVVRDTEKSVLRWWHYIDTAKSEAPEMASWQERRLKLLSNGFPVMITGALEFVHMYVGRHMSYIFYTEILFQYLKRHGKKIMNLKECIFICLSASWECLFWGKKRANTSALWEAICWMLKSLCENVKCWRHLQPVTPPPPLFCFCWGCLSKLLYTPLTQDKKLLARESKQMEHLPALLMVYLALKWAK